MPAERTRRTRQSHFSDDESIGSTSSPKHNVAFTNVTACAFENPVAPASSHSSCESLLFAVDDAAPAPRSAHSKKKPVNHIPRPPNAFILFRSAFIKNQHVSTEVETSHSTLSKIIGLTWQNLPDEERQIWHAKAKIAQAEHKRKFPQYAFKPVHNKPRGQAGEKRKVREVGMKDNKRCEKIAELLVGGKTGQELKKAIEEFDKHHVPEIVTRFEAPITARSFSESLSKAPKESSPSSPRRYSEPPSSDRSLSRTASPPSFVFSNDDEQQFNHVPSNMTLYRDPSPSFDFNTYSFPPASSSTFPPPSYRTHTPVVGSLDDAFASSVMSSLAVNETFANMNDWARSHSPMSTSTGSMPTTPALVGIHFPETYQYPAQPSHHGGLDYRNFSNNPGYSEQYIADEGNFTLPPNFGQVDPMLHFKSSMVPAEVDFTHFMMPMPDYSL